MSAISLPGGVTGQTGRNSGIEALKLAAVCLIVFFHVLTSMCSDASRYMDGQLYQMLRSATVRPDIFLTRLAGHFGQMGNYTFFVCSAWFLIDSGNWNRRKWFGMIVELWLLNIAILAVTLALRGGELPFNKIFRSFFPTIFGNNWYMTAYIMFYPIHPLLNRLSGTMGRRELLRLSLASAFIYFFVDFLLGDYLFASDFICWLAVYFIMTYMKKYARVYCDDRRKNLIALATGAICWVGIELALNLLGLRFDALHARQLYFRSDYNPFILVMVFSAFNLARQARLRSKAVNYLAGLSMLVYVLHDGMLVRQYMRPVLVNAFDLLAGNLSIIPFALILSAVVLLGAYAIAILYDLLVRKSVTRLSSHLFEKAKGVYLKLEDAVTGSK